MFQECKKGKEKEKVLKTGLVDPLLCNADEQHCRCGLDAQAYWAISTECVRTVR